MKNTAPTALLIDATGVLYESQEGSDGIAIPGSIEAIEILRARNVPFRVLSNAATKTTPQLVAKLNRIGFRFTEAEVIGPVPATLAFIKSENIRPAVFVHKGIADVFQAVNTENSPDALLVSYMEEDFSYRNLNKMVSILLKMKEPKIISIGNGILFQRTHSPCLDIGAFVAMLKHVVPRASHIVMGKPSPSYFEFGLQSLGKTREEVVMIGDDPKADIIGAKNFGLKAIQVRTGKFLATGGVSNEATLVVDNLLSAVNHYYG